MNTLKNNHFSFINGPIQAGAISQTIQNGEAHHDVGAYSIFLGQVRNDVIENKEVHKINYTANKEMAESVMMQILSDSHTQFNTKAVHVLHSLSEVAKGEICLLVMVLCGHRKESFKACEYIVERLKKELPVWGQEIFEDNTNTWKINK